MHYKILYAVVTMPALASAFFLHSKPTVVSFRTFPNTPSTSIVTPTSKGFLFDRKLSRSLREAHSNAFPKDKNTYPNASTVDLAKECVADMINAKRGCGYNSKIQCRLCSSAAEHGSMPALQYLRSVGCEWNERTCANAALYGDLQILQYARDNGCPWDEWTCAEAALNGHLPVLQWARNNDCPWNALTCAFAAENGHLDILQWARANDCPWDEWTLA